MSVRDSIIAFAQSIGLEKVGFARAEGGGTKIVALFPYYVPNEDGNLSMYARGRDYHQVAEEKLKKICGFLEQFTKVPCKIFVDKGTQDDRAAAYQAGLGFYGRNGMLICEEYGSYFFIGYIYTDLELPADKPLRKTCMECGACEQACVGGALRSRTFDIARCVSDISQRKGKLSTEEEKLLIQSGLCWGCDVCQTVCPHNRDLPVTALPEFLEHRICNLRLEDLEDISNREFLRRYADYAFQWRGKQPIERNLLLLGEKHAQK